MSGIRNYQNELQLLYDSEFIEQYELFSFDLFDTLLLRDSGNHFNLWKIRSKKFAIARTFAEIYARILRRLQGFYEVNSEQIYERIHIRWSLKSEITLEDDHLYLNLEIVEIINRLLNSKKTVVIISDTHFDAITISNWLTARGLPGLRIFTSQEFLKPKSRGLYECVRTHMGVNYSKWLHVGDNYYSDLLAPKKFGINCIYYPKLIDQIIDAGLLSRKGIKRLLRNDELGRSVLKKILIAFAEIQYINARQDLSLEYLVALLISNPIAQSMANEIGKSIIDKQTSSYWFSSRDGWLPFKAFSSRHPDLQIRYFCTSRKLLIDPKYSEYVQQFLNGEKTIFIFDLGWRGSTVRKLREFYPNILWVGVFLGFLGKIDNPHYQLYIGPKLQFISIWRARDFLEQIFSDLGESFEHLTENFIPIRRKTLQTNRNSPRKLIAYHADANSNLFLMELSMKEASLLLTIFSVEPNLKLIELFRNTLHDVNGKYTKLVHSSWITLFSSSPVMWPQAARLEYRHLGPAEDFIFRLSCLLKETGMRVKSLLGRSLNS